MSRPLIAIAALLTSVLASAGELDGKALICGELAEDDDLLYWEFEDGRVMGTEIIIQGTKAAARELGQKLTDEEKTYRVHPNNADWWSFWHLDRTTLDLEFKDGYEREAEYKYQCELSTSLEAERLKAQKAIDERMKDNKI